MERQREEVVGWEHCFLAQKNFHNFGEDLVAGLEVVLVVVLVEDHLEIVDYTAPVVRMG